MNVRRKWSALSLLVLLAMPACESPGGPSQREVRLLLLLGGDLQTAAPGATLPNPLVVAAYDFESKPVAGVEVSFTVRTGGGTMSPQTVRTNESGIAQSRWTLGGAPGSQEATASVQVNATEAVVAEFRAVAAAAAGGPNR
jgi:hypothetical protein